MWIQPEITIDDVARSMLNSGRLTMRQYVEFQLAKNPIQYLKQFI